MAKSEALGSKGNSSDTLWAVYLLQILKRHSSSKTKLTTKEVYKYLKDEYSIKTSENEDAQIKKARRHLYTLHESNKIGCIRMQEGRSKADGNLWWYEAARDTYAGENVQVQETLSDIEIGVLVDLLSATKILNSEGTRGIIDKLLKKSSLSDDDRRQKLDAIQEEEWYKTPNVDILDKKAFLQECIEARVSEEDNIIVFDYENENSIKAVPVGWSFDDGCYLVAIVEDKRCMFSLDKIRLHYDECGGYEDPEDYRLYDKENDSDLTTIDSLFVNIPTINNAITDEKCITFQYDSYKVDRGKIVQIPDEKSVLPRHLAFNDGKYYLIGIDVANPELNKVVYFRVDLMFELHESEKQIKLSGSNKHDFEAIERARVVDNHPRMRAGKDEKVTFKVIESELDRVVDAFNVTPDRMKVTKETRKVKNSSGEGVHDELVVSVDIKTSEEEAFRWALANADAVEITTPKIRDRIARLAAPIYQLYTQSIADKVRANYDYIKNTGMFIVDETVELEVALATFEKLESDGETDIVSDICLKIESGEPGSYLGAFTNAKSLHIVDSPDCQTVDWARTLSKINRVKLDGTQIEDVSWLSGMSNLDWLTIFHSPVADLSVIKNHTDIHTLHLFDTNIYDISFIKNYRNLSWLVLNGCPIKDYSPLYELTSHLRSLEIDERAASKIDLEKIRERHIGIDIRVIKDGHAFGV